MKEIGDELYCADIKFGTYKCAYDIILPYLVKFRWEDGSELKIMNVAIDKCLLPEILELWKMGIKTTGCCCGHGNSLMAFIGVNFEFISKMKEMGYKVWINDCRPNDEDSFIPKTKIEYGKIPYSKFKRSENIERD